MRRSPLTTEFYLTALSGWYLIYSEVTHLLLSLCFLYTAYVISRVLFKVGRGYTNTGLLSSELVLLLALYYYFVTVPTMFTPYATAFVTLVYVLSRGFIKRMPSNKNIINL